MFLLVGHLSHTCWTLVEGFLDTCCALVVHLMGTCWICVGHLLDTCSLCFVTDRTLCWQNKQTQNHRPRTQHTITTHPTQYNKPTQINTTTSDNQTMQSWGARGRQLPRGALQGSRSMATINISSHPSGTKGNENQPATYIYIYIEKLSQRDPL